MWPVLQPNILGGALNISGLFLGRPDSANAVVGYNTAPGYFPSSQLAPGELINTTVTIKGDNTISGVATPIPVRIGKAQGASGTFQVGQYSPFVLSAILTALGFGPVIWTTRIKDWSRSHSTGWSFLFLYHRILVNH